MAAIEGPRQYTSRSTTRSVSVARCLQRLVIPVHLAHAPSLVRFWGVQLTNEGDTPLPPPKKIQGQHGRPMTGVGVLLCFRGGCGLERCQSTSRMASVAVMLNLRADALTAACSGYQSGRPTTGIKAASGLAGHQATLSLGVVRSSFCDRWSINSVQPGL